MIFYTYDNVCQSFRHKYHFWRCGLLGFINHFELIREKYHLNLVIKFKLRSGFNRSTFNSLFVNKNFLIRLNKPEFQMKECTFSMLKMGVQPVPQKFTSSESPPLSSGRLTLKKFVTAKKLSNSRLNFPVEIFRLLGHVTTVFSEVIGSKRPESAKLYGILPFTIRLLRTLGYTV